MRGWKRPGKARLHGHTGPGLPAAAGRLAGVLPLHSWPWSRSPSPWGTVGRLLEAGHTGCWVLTCNREGPKPRLEWGLRTGGQCPSEGEACFWGAGGGGRVPLGPGVRLSGAWQEAPEWEQWALQQAWAWGPQAGEESQSPGTALYGKRDALSTAHFLQPWCNMMRSGPSHLRGPAQTKQSGKRNYWAGPLPPGPCIRTSSAPALHPGTHVSILLLCFSAWFPLRQR